MAVANGKAYLLANQEESVMGHMEVFELDLQTWHCQLLPCHGEAPPLLGSTHAVVAEVIVSVPSCLVEQNCFDKACLGQTGVLNLQVSDLQNRCP